jgi:hypothetical protein
MADMKFIDEGGAVPEDMMERLMREQTFAGDGDDEDEDTMPDWATEGDESTNLPSDSGLKLKLSVNETQQPTAKRSLLLEVGNFIFILCLF